MKAKALPLLCLFIALNFQCSDDTVETDLLSGQPLPRGADSPEGTFSNLIDIIGYSDGSNARIIVNSVDSIEVASEYAYIAEWLLGSGDSSSNSSNTTEVYFEPFNNSLWVKSPESSIFALLCVRNDSGRLYLPHWDLTYSLEYCNGCDPGFSLFDISISGTGKGSHLFNPYKYDNLDLFEASEVTFKFNGAQVDGRGYESKGNFSIIEKSPESVYNLAVYGTLTIVFD